MYLADIDLAWGPRKPTGIAVLNAEGWLQHIGTAVQNEIVDDIAPYFVRRRDDIAIHGDITTDWVDGLIATLRFQNT